MTQNFKILKRPEVEATTGLKRSTIYDKMEKNSFPKPVKLGPRSVGWLEHEIQGWLSDRIAEGRGGLSHE
jgi:prophage regulatory protein